MNGNHRAFFRTPLGRQLEAILREPYQRYGYVLMSLVEQPAINAVTWQLDPLIGRLAPKQRGHAKQSCGAMVGEIMIDEVGARRAVTRSGRARSKRVRGSRLFRMGALWVVPANAHDDAVRPLRTL